MGASWISAAAAPSLSSTRVDEGYPTGTRLNVRFQLVRLGEIDCRAIVRRDVEGKGIGIEFLDLEAPEQERLSALFAKATAAPPDTPSDRRQSPRVRVFGADDVDVWVDGAEDQERRSGRLVDLSAGGASLALDHGYPTGTCLSVRFQLVRLGEISCRAIVRRDIEGKGVGIEFLDLEAPEQEQSFGVAIGMTAGCRRSASGPRACFSTRPKSRPSVHLLAGSCAPA